MVFSSITFLFFFLPVVLVAYLCVGRHGRNLFLLTASLFFYLWGEQIYVLVMLASITINYIFGLLIERSQAQGKTGKAALVAGVFANLALLGFFKYANFVVANLNALLTQTGIEPIQMQAVHLPIGISFFTFQALSYIIDLYRGNYPAQKNPLHLGLYISLFPQLIAGPIIRYHDIAGQIKKRRVRLEDFGCGAERFILGLGKKILIANPMGQMADHVFAMQAGLLTTTTAWLGICCYSLQIYFDFSGYSDMAIGLGRMLGFRFPENFNYPYISRSIREFWRRWHISLSSWFRDYLYIPLGGNRLGSKRTNFNLLLVFLLCGLWHGASWNFIIWGLVHGVFLVLERGYLGRLLNTVHPLWQHCYALLVVINAWVFFRVGELEDTGTFFAVLYGFAGADTMLPQLTMDLDLFFFISLGAGIVLSLPVYPWLQREWGLWQQGNARRLVLSLPIQMVKLSIITGILFYSAGSLAVGSYNPFIYFRF